MTILKNKKTPIILSGKTILENVKNIQKDILQEGETPPRLEIILVGHNPASEIYVKGKKKDCEECGFICNVNRFNEDVTEEELLDFINDMNDKCDGLFVQLPLPNHIDKTNIINTISPKVDVDGFTNENLGKIISSQTNDEESFIPCTPLGIMLLLSEYNIDVKGMNCVIINDSAIVGRPLGLLLIENGATVTICHKYTKNLKLYTKKADLVISAVGIKNFITADMIKKNSIIIDVGINKDENGKLCGDVDFKNVSKKCKAITPVPGGIGLTTRAGLLWNLSNSFINKKVGL